MVSKESIETFCRLLQSSKEAVLSFTNTDNGSKFISKYTMFSIMDKEDAEEAFYAQKLGYYYAEYSPKLTYILDKASKLDKNPNSALSRISKTIMEPLRSRVSDDELEKLMSAIYDRPVTLLTNTKRVVRNGSVFEMLLPDGSVAVLSEELGEMVLGLDKPVITYDTSGIAVNGILLRTYGGRLGIVTSDLDLTEVI